MCACVQIRALLHLSHFFAAFKPKPPGAAPPFPHGGSTARRGTTGDVWGHELGRGAAGATREHVGERAGHRRRHEPRRFQRRQPRPSAPLDVVQTGPSCLKAGRKDGESPESAQEDGETQSGARKAGGTSETKASATPPRPRLMMLDNNDVIDSAAALAVAKKLPSPPRPGLMMLEGDDFPPPPEACASKERRGDRDCGKPARDEEEEAAVKGHEEKETLRGEKECKETQNKEYCERVKKETL